MLGQDSRKNNAKEIISIGEKLILSADSSHRNSAIQMLTYTYSEIGDKENALKYAKTVPVLEDYVVSVLDGKELAEHCKQSLWYFCDLMSIRLSYLTSSKEAGYSNAEKHKLHKMLEDMYNLIFSDGDFGSWEERLGRNKFEMAKLSAKCGKYERAIAEIEEAFEHFEKYESFTSIDHTSLPVRGIHYEASMSVKNYSRSTIDEYTAMLDNPCFDCVGENKQFIEVRGKVKSMNKIG